MTDILHEDLHTFMATLVTNTGNRGCCGYLVPWLPVVPIFLGCYSRVVAPEAFCSADISYLIFCVWLNNLDTV